jgi:hypothetical protein
VRARAEREGLDLSRCAAYSDSANDLPMLTLVGTAVAVNPDTDLRAVARARGWQIRDFRTGRKAARIGVPTVAAAAVSGGLVGGAIALRRRNRRPAPFPGRDHRQAGAFRRTRSVVAGAVGRSRAGWSRAPDR